MEFSVSYARGRVPVTVLHVKGAITTNVELERQAQALFDAGARYLLVDLTYVPYIATYGLRALYFIYALLSSAEPAASEAGHGAPRLKLLRPSRHALEALKVAGYDLFLEIYRDYDQAIAAF